MFRKKILGLILILFSLGAPQLGMAGNQNFLSLADIHFDPYLSCKQKPCPLIKKLKEAPADQWAGILAQGDHSVARYGRDSNYALLASTLEEAKMEAQKNQVQFVLILGDFLGHDYDNKYRRYSGDKTKAGTALFVNKTLEFYRDELKQAFPHTSVYWVVGNNDGYEAHYFQEPGGQFFKTMAKLGSSLIRDERSRQEMQSQFSPAGYYALNIPQEPRLRLIVLNSVLFSTEAKGPGIDQAAEGELTWFHQQLKEAAEHNQRVLIAMHIPTGIDVYTTLFIPFSIFEFWKKPYNQRFLAEIKQNADQVLGVFTGHIHADVFHVYSVNDQSAIPFAGTPAISPIFGNNPGFKVYSYSEPALRLVDMDTYTYSLSGHQWAKVNTPLLH